MASQGEKDSGKGKGRPKPLEAKGKETAKITKGRETAKITKNKNKMSLPGAPQHHLKKCPTLYAPHDTNACDYLPIILRFFEDFKLQLQMAQKECVTFVPWSAPLTTSKKDWQVEKDDDKSVTNKTALPLTLSLPSSPAVKQRQKETKSKKETVEVDSLWDWDCHAFDSDDQRLFYDSDQNVDPKSSQATSSLVHTPPHSPTTTPPSKHKAKSSPLDNNISIDISSSNSNASSIIHHGRRKRKLLGRKIMGSSDVTYTGSKQSNSSSRPSLTSSLPKGPVYHHPLSSPSISNDGEEPEEPTDQLHNKKRYEMYTYDMHKVSSII